VKIFVLGGALVILVSGAFSRPAVPGTQTQSIVSTVEQIQEDFRNVPCRLKDRQGGVRALFGKMGAPDDALTIEKRDNVENLVLRLDSASPETIVIGAHYDHIERGCGAVDNWSGIVTLAHAYRSIRQRPVHKKVLFVAFGREEEGLLGSKAMVRAIPKEDLPNYCAMINIDSFGLARPFALENASSKSLMTLAKKTAEELKIPFYTVPIMHGDSDSSSFVARGIPAVTLSGLSNDWMKILHTSSDQQSKVIPLSVYLGYRLALLMWRTVDEAPCSAYRPG
jgi:hypothetical protein